MNRFVCSPFSSSLARIASRSFATQQQNFSNTLIWVDHKVLVDALEGRNEPLKQCFKTNGVNVTHSVMYQLTSEQNEKALKWMHDNFLFLHSVPSAHLSETFKVVSEIWLKNGSVKVDDLLSVENNLYELWESAKGSQTWKYYSVFLTESPQLRSLVENPETRELAFVTIPKDGTELAVISPSEFIAGVDARTN